ncbi:DUF397 domain-containing protein [Streptomyces sp. NPDC029526]|uniref:DUF397 domain-containing protein n=1 Tax=Streptomyces sp. NPDC029526 TaxID=3155728 RepID=UPI0033C01608
MTAGSSGCPARRCPGGSAAVHVHDSEDRHIRRLVVTPAAWTAFAALVVGVPGDG